MGVASKLYRVLSPNVNKTVMIFKNDPELVELLGTLHKNRSYTTGMEGAQLLLLLLLLPLWLLLIIIVELACFYCCLRYLMLFIFIASITLDYISHIWIMCCTGLVSSHLFEVFGLCLCMPCILKLHDILHASHSLSLFYTNFVQLCWWHLKYRWRDEKVCYAKMTEILECIRFPIFSLSISHFVSCEKRIFVLSSSH